LKKEWAAAVDPLRGEIRSGLEKLKEQGQSAFGEPKQVVESSFDRLREETKAMLEKSRVEIHSVLQSIGEEGKGHLRSLLSSSNEETKAEIESVRNGVEGLKQQVPQIAEDLQALTGKVKEGFVEVKEELGSMIKFSYADLEKRLATLEARVKALEKMVLP
jgi:gas vesicle protein